MNRLARLLPAPAAGRAVVYALLLLVLGVPLALGGAHRVTVQAAALVAVCAFLLLGIYKHHSGGGIRLGRYGLLLLALCCYTGLQLVPLPFSLLDLLAPRTAELLRVSLEGAGQRPRWHPISLAPADTLWGLLRLGLATLVFLLARNLLHRRQRQERLLQGLMGLGVVTTSLGLIGAVVAPGKPLLLYQPIQGPATGLIATSFVNPNHGAAFLMVATLAALGLAAQARALNTRALLFVAATVTGIGVFLSLSRGGILAFAVALAAYGVLQFFRRGEGASSARRLALVALFAGAVIAAATWLAGDQILAELQHRRADLPLGKLALWPAGWALVRAHWLVGVGRGAVATALPRYRGLGLPADVTYTSLENQYLQLPAEWGLPLGAVVIGLSAAALVVWWRRRRDDGMQLAVVAALIGLALHNLVDFNLELPGVALPAAALAGMLASRRPSRPRRDVPARLLLLPATLALVLGLCALTAFGRSSVNDAPRALRSGLPAQAVQRALAQAITRRPADYLPHLAQAQLALVAGKRRETMKALNRALFLYPRSPALHLAAASALRHFGHRRQALLEYRLALEAGADPAQMLDGALSACRTASDVAALLPPKAATLWGQAVELLRRRGRLALALALIDRADAGELQDPTLLRSEVVALLAAGQHALALERARTLVERNPTAEHALLLADATARANPGADLAVLEQAWQQHRGSHALGLALAGARTRAGRHDQAASLAEELLRACRSSTELAQVHYLLATIHRAAGRPHRAGYELEEARKVQVVNPR
ncbi:MAG: O-antigen ligase family protein [Proteobacteria bacterium]|nr:O-antigen ligase family protein [Pseudomonadota bacterium]